MGEESSTPNPHVNDTTTLNQTASRLEPVLPIVHTELPLEIIPLETFEMFQSVSLVISQGISLMGVANNVINIVVFVKLGLRETTSISMMSLAVSDLLYCVLSLWSNLLYFPPFVNSGINFRPNEIFIMTGGHQRIFVSRTSALILTYIAVERCLCVITPLKVKSIITRRRTGIAIATIFLITIGPSFFVFGNYRFVYRFYPDVNKTLLGVRYVDGVANLIVDRIVTILTGTVFLLGTFATTCVCTVYLVVYLSRTSKWRQGHSNFGAASSDFNSSGNVEQSLSEDNVQDKSVTISVVDSKKVSAKQRNTNSKHATAKQSDNNSKQGSAKQSSSNSSKEDRVARTVVVISIVFIVCFLPTSVSCLLYVLLPGYSLYGRYSQMFILINSIGYFTETINSSVNLFIYYRMGTNFRSMIFQIFKCREKK